MFRVVLLVGWVLVGVGAVAQMTTRPSETRRVEYEIIRVEGIAQVRESETDPWRKAKVGERIQASVMARVGPRSAIHLKLPSGESHVIDRLGTTTIKDSLRSKTAQPAPGYGRVRYEIEAEGVENNSTIYAPGSTLAVYAMVFDREENGVMYFKCVRYSGEEWEAIQKRDRERAATRPTTQPAS